MQGEQKKRKVGGCVVPPKQSLICHEKWELSELKSLTELTADPETTELLKLLAMRFLYDRTSEGKDIKRKIVASRNDVSYGTVYSADGGVYLQPQGGCSIGEVPLWVSRLCCGNYYTTLQLDVEAQSNNIESKRVHDCFIDAVQEQGFIIGAYMYTDDGSLELVIEKSTLINPMKIEEMRLLLTEETGFTVVITQTDKMVPTPTDTDKKYGERFGHLMKPDNYLKHLICREAYTKKYRRRPGRVMIPHKSIPGVYVVGVKNDVFINATLLHMEGLQSCKMKDLIEWFDWTDNPMFPMVPCFLSNDIISFTNGFLNIDKLIFTSWQDVAAEDIPFTEHYFDVEVNMQEILKIATPHYDKYILHQVSNSVKEKLDIFTGRMFYPVGKFDNWQCALYFWGDAGTGKSTLINTIQSMFPSHQIGIISDTTEKKFGLQTLAEKRIIMMPDAPKDMNAVMDKSTLQSIVSGDKVNVANKFKESGFQVLQAHMMMAGNYPMNYEDTGSALGRRLVCVRFDTHVHPNLKDTKLNVKLQSELIPIMIQSIFKYRAACIEYGDSDVWKWLPDELIETRNEMRMQTSVFANFLANGDPRCQILYIPGHHEEWKDLERVYSNHIEFSHKNSKHSRKITDKQALLDAGYSLVTRHICKICSAEQSVGVCGDHYHKNNKVSRVWVYNMSILKIAGPANGSASMKP
jgi:hypothetical protein